MKYLVRYTVVVDITAPEDISATLKHTNTPKSKCKNPSPAWQVQFTRSDEIGSVYHNALYRLRAFDMTKYQDKMKIEILELNSNECIS